MTYCHTPAPDWRLVRAKYTPEYFRNAEAKDSGETLYVDARWVVMYNREEEKISVDRVRDCHRMLNLIYGAKNLDELAKVPDTKFAPFKDLIGNPNIQFLPLNSDEVHPEYVAVSRDLDSQTPVDDAASLAGRADGVLNIYIGDTGGGSILGQAQLNSNILYNLYSTVGGYNVQGTLPRYQMGKTVAHEVGHALGLVHTFTDSQCDGHGPFADTAEQVNPNFSTELYVNSQGEWEQRGDNRWKDKNLGTHYSCLNQEADPENAPYEMGINVMDYGYDAVSIMFTKSQAIMMREYLKSPENSSVLLLNADSVSINVAIGQGMSVAGTSAEVADSGSQLSTGAIVGIVVGVVVGVIALILLWYFGWYSKHRPNMKQATSYETAESQEPWASWA